MAATVVFSPVGNGFQWFGQTGLVLAGGKINTYLAGSTTKAATYTDNTGTVANGNPITLDSTGRYAQEIWLDVTLIPYKFVITDALGVIQFTLDNIPSTTTGATNISYIYPATGAVSTTLQQKAQQIVSVFDFMNPAQIADVIANTLTQDVTTAIQNAINASPSVYFPIGSYLVSAQINLKTNTALYGQDAIATIISTNSATANILSCPNAAYYEIRELSFTSSVTRSAGAFIITTSAGGFIDTCYFSKYFIGISDGDNTGLVRDCTFSLPIAATGVGIKVTGPCNGVVFENVLMIPPGAGNQPAAGIQITSAASLFINNCGIIQQGHALDIIPGSGTGVSTVFCENTFFDSSTIGINIAPTGTGNVVRCRFKGCWTSSSPTNRGINITGGTGIVDGIDFLGHMAVSNSSDGCFLGYGTNVNFYDCAFAGNGGAGISVASGITFWSIINCNLCSGYGVGGNQYGIFISGAGTCANYRIQNCNVTGNTTGAIAGTGTSPAFVSENLGYNPQGVSAITVGASPFSHAAGHSPEEVYITGAAITSAVVNGITLSAATNCVIRLAPFQTLVTTYPGAAPTMNKSIE